MWAGALDYGTVVQRDNQHRPHVAKFKLIRPFRKPGGLAQAHDGRSALPLPHNSERNGAGHAGSSSLSARCGTFPSCSNPSPAPMPAHTSPTLPRDANSGWRTLIRRLATPLALAAFCGGVLSPFAPTARAQVSQPQGSRFGAAADEASEQIMLGEFQVTTTRDTGYRATNALSGTRFNTSLIDLPKPVDVITSEFIEDIGALDLSEAVAYATSISSANAAAADDITGSNFNVRGFNTFTTYRNGFRHFGIIDPINIDRIEIIKGPSSVFSGPIEPGGTINTITKMPSRQASYSLGTRYASFDSKRLEATATGPLNASRSLAYRAAAALSHTGYRYDFSGLDKSVLGGALSWKVSDRTSLLFEGQYVNNRSKPVATSRIVNAARNGYEKGIPDSFNRNGPNAYSNTIQYSGTLEGNHRFGDRWSMRAGLYYRNQCLARFRDTGSAVLTSSAAVPGGRLLNRQGEYEPNADSFVLSPTVNLLGSFAYGPVKHRLILGYEYYYELTRNDVYRRSFTGAAALNLNAPTYELGDPSTYAASDLRRTWSEQSAASFSNVFTLFKDRLILLQGLRTSTTDDERKNLRTPVVRVQNHLRATVPNYGLTFKLRPDLALFATYSEAYLPPNLQGALSDYQGNPFPPSTGKGTDFGVKFDLYDGRVSGNVTAYAIDRENTLIPDPFHSGYNISEGLTEVRGLDATVALSPIAAWQLLAGYSYTDGRLVNGTYPNGRIGNIPMHKATVWNRYKFGRGPLSGLRLGLGVIFVGERRGNSALADLPGLSSPGYTIINANLSYERRLWGRQWSWSLQGTNLADRRYYASAAGLGEPFSVGGTMRVRF